MKQYVCRLMEEAEPKMVSCFVSGSQLNNCFSWRQPLGRTAESHIVKRLYQRKHNAGLVT